MTAEETLLRRPFSIIGFVLLGIETLVGMVANGFIVIVICRDWFRSRKLSPTELILICLALSRLIWQIVVILDITLAFFFVDTFKVYGVLLMLSIVRMFINTVDLWFAAWLSCLYFSKIAVFSHPIFLQVKRRFSGLVPRLLLATVIVSAFMTFILVKASAFMYSICKTNMPFLTNRNNSKIQMPHLCPSFDLITVIPNVIPIMIFLSSTTLLITSLWKHIRRVQHNGLGVQDLSTQVHLTAIKALASFAILYMSSFVTVSLLKVLSWRSGFSIFTAVFFYNVGALYPSGHAIILIFINPKLKQAWVRMLDHFTCRLIEAQS